MFHNRLMVTGAKTTFTNGSTAGPLQSYQIAGFEKDKTLKFALTHIKGLAHEN